VRILVAWPPQVPSYFNAGHHLPVFSVAAYLRELGHDTVAVDAGALNFTWKDFADLIWQGEFQAIFLVNEFDVAEGIHRAADYCRAIAPAAKLCTFGRLSYQVPDFFTSLPLDGIGYSGDHEAAAKNFAGWVQAGCQETCLPGVTVRLPDGWSSRTVPGELLPPEHWVLPDTSEIPYDAYDRLYTRDQNKFCGIPDRRELVVPVARGCPVNCDFCDVPVMQGLRERRLPVERAVAYIRDCFARGGFEYVAFYAPTFTLNRRWTIGLCRELRAQPRVYPWKCATTLHSLDEELVRLMRDSGCVRISVGLETLEQPALDMLPQAKRKHIDEFRQAAAWCRTTGIELNCFVIAGLPGTTTEGVRTTLDLVRQAGARSRPTLYTPYHEMHGAMSEAELSRFNRQVPVPSQYEQSDPRQWAGVHALLFGRDEYATPAPSLVDSGNRGG
jgi:anaerobic magnesium-protoporphyrin IX monomethyl ester cyclase